MQNIQQILSWHYNHITESTFNCSMPREYFAFSPDNIRIINGCSTCVALCMVFLASWMSLSSRRVGFLPYSSFMLHKPKDSTWSQYNAIFKKFLQNYSNRSIPRQYAWRNGRNNIQCRTHYRLTMSSVCDTPQCSSTMQRAVGPQQEIHNSYQPKSYLEQCIQCL